MECRPFWGRDTPMKNLCVDGEGEGQDKDFPILN
jgi:hypothetical protein